MGLWTSVIGCGQGVFPILSLGSALPQNYKDEEAFFSGNIQGEYSSTMSSGTTKYLLSIGGSNATQDGWTAFLKDVDPSTFLTQCRTRGIVGIDFDIEEFPTGIVDLIHALAASLKRLDSSFLIMYTILLGYESFAPLLVDGSVYDFLTLMLYNGGMYRADGTGAGCDWDQWAEIFLSKGQRGCPSPLFEDLAVYAKTANLALVDPTKVLLGVIVDTVGPRFDASMLDRVEALLTTYHGAGWMIWTAPGFATSDAIDQIRALGVPIDPQTCVVSDTCPAPDAPCDGDCVCVATSCGMKKQGVRDEDCRPCPQQGYWPCDQQGFCACESKAVRS